MTAKSIRTANRFQPAFEALEARTLLDATPLMTTLPAVVNVPSGLETMPAIVNPVAMTFDERGRIWITESLEYPRR